MSGFQHEDNSGVTPRSDTNTAGNTVFSNQITFKITVTTLVV